MIGSRRVMIAGATRDALASVKSALEKAGLEVSAADLLVEVVAAAQQTWAPELVVLAGPLAEAASDLSLRLAATRAKPATVIYRPDGKISDLVNEVCANLKLGPLENMSDDELDSALLGERTDGTPPPPPRPVLPGPVLPPRTDVAVTRPPPSVLPPRTDAAVTLPTPSVLPRHDAVPRRTGQARDRRRYAAHWNEAPPSDDPGPASVAPVSPTRVAATDSDDERLFNSLEQNYLRYAGYLDQTPVPEVVGRIVMARESGILLLRKGEISKSVSFVAGDPVFATSNFDRDRLPEVLIRGGRVSRDRVEDALGRGEVGENRMALLRELGLDGPEDALDALQRQILTIIDSIFEWRSGDFSFVLFEPAPSSSVRLPIPAPAIVVSGIRAHFARPEILRRLRGDAGTPVIVAPPAPSPARLGLSSSETELLGRVDDRATVAQLMAEHKPDETARLLYALVALGLVRIRITASG